MLIIAIAIVIVSIAYAYTMLVEVKAIRKELDNLRKKYERENPIIIKRKEDNV